MSPFLFYILEQEAMYAVMVAGLHYAGSDLILKFTVDYEDYIRVRSSHSEIIQHKAAGRKAAVHILG